MRRIVICLALAAVLAASPAMAQAPKRETSAQRAAKMYSAGCSAMRTRQFDQAKGLFEKYVRSYGTHEYVAVGYLLLAHCSRQVKDTKAYEQALADVIGRFRGSPAWHCAYTAKLYDAVAAKDHDEFVKVLRELSAASPELPTDMWTCMGMEYGQYYSRFYYGRHFWAWMVERGVGRRTPGWIMLTVKAADTPERAEKILAALARTLKRRAGDLPVDWEFAHVQLLRKAGKADEAEKLLREYLAAWTGGADGGSGAADGPDPRGIGLYLLWIQDATARKDTQAAERAYKEMIETYWGASSLGDAVYQRLAALSRADRWDEFTTLAKKFLANYTTNRYWGYVASLWVSSATAKARAGDKSRIASAEAMMDEFYKSKHPATLRTLLLWRIGFRLAEGKVDEAAKLAPGLVEQSQWCAASFSQLGTWTASYKQFAPVLEAARTKWTVPVANPTSKAFGMLNKLRLRLKDDQVRHAEEIAEEMFSNYPRDDATIQAVKTMADYYFKKVLIEPRDKWMKRMVDSYPFHPVTEGVLATQIRAEGAGKKYDRQAQAIDKMMERFPGNHYPYWYSYRITCYNAAQDADGRLAFVKRYHGPAADAGSTTALAEICKYEFASLEGPEAKGDAWLALAKKYAGTRTELYCRSQAWYHYYYYPRWSSYRDKVQWDKAIAVAKSFQTQKIDPQLAWRFAFGDISLLAGEGKKTAPMLSALNSRIKLGVKRRDLSGRLDFYAIGAALGKAGQLKQARSVARKLKGVTFTRRDRAAVELLQAGAHGGAEDYETAATHYLAVVYSHPFPSYMYPYFNSALSLLTRARSKRTIRAIELYMGKIGRTQELVPTLLYQIGYRQSGLAAAVAARNRLASRYPCSKARDDMDARVERLRPKPRPRR